MKTEATFMDHVKVRGTVDERRGKDRKEKKN